MILDATTDNLEIILDKAITTNQLSFSVFYNEYTSTTVTPMSNYGTTNSTTAVNLIAAPTSGKQRQLRWCGINNVDTADIGVKIRFNANSTIRNILYVYLRVGESIQYSEEMGWRIYDSYGSEKLAGYGKIPSAIKNPEWLGVASAAGTLATVGSTAYCSYLGKVERPFSSIKIQWKTTVALSGGGAWGEIGIYKGSPTMQSNTAFTRLGYVDDTTNFTAAAGLKTSTITTSNMAIGDDIWVVLSNSGGTQATVRAGGVADNLGVGFFQTAVSTRPSTASTFTGSIDNSTSNIWYAWQGIYQGT